MTTLSPRAVCIVSPVPSEVLVSCEGVLVVKLFLFIRLHHKKTIPTFRRWLWQPVAGVAINTKKSNTHTEGELIVGSLCEEGGTRSCARFCSRAGETRPSPHHKVKSPA